MSNFSNAAKDGIEASKNVAVLVREVAQFGGDVSAFVPKIVAVPSAGC